MILRYSLLALLCGLWLPAEEMLLAFSSHAYSGNAETVWQSLMPVQSMGKQMMDAVPLEIPLLDSDSGQPTGLRLKVTPPEEKQEIVSYQSHTENAERLFRKNPFNWFDPSLAPLRQSFSLNPESGAWTFEILGAGEGESLSVEWVFVRFKDGPRLITLTGPDGQDILNKADVGQSGSGQYVQSGPFPGGQPLRFTLQPSGKGWACLPNAIRLLRKDP